MPASGSEVADCPLEVRVGGGEVTLFVTSERLGIVLDPAVAVALGRSLIAAAEEVTL